MNVVKVFCFCLLAAWSGLYSLSARADLTIAAAATMRFAMEDIKALYQEQTGKALKVSYGSTGNLYRQILQGAPFDVLLAADESYVLRLHKDGVVPTAGRIYAEGRIGLFVANGTPYQADTLFAGLEQAIANKQIRRFAIANPEHAPYGMRAKEALVHKGLYETLKPVLVFGENIAQATQFVTTGSAQAGIIAQSLALSPSIASQGAFALIPKTWHAPLTQRMVVVRPSQDADAFMDFFQNKQVAGVLRKYGYEVP